MRLHRLTTNAFQARTDWPIQYWMMLTPLILGVVLYFVAMLSVKHPTKALMAPENDTRVVTHISDDWENVPVVVVQYGGTLMATQGETTGENRIAPVQLNDLSDQARQWHHVGLPERTYLIVDENVPYARVSDVLGELRQAGRDQVLFMRRPFSI